jgi:hypothetical protein
MACFVCLTSGGPGVVDVHAVMNSCQSAGSFSLRTRGSHIVQIKAGRSNFIDTRVKEPNVHGEKLVQQLYDPAESGQETTKYPLP